MLENMSESVYEEPMNITPKCARAEFQQVSYVNYVKAPDAPVPVTKPTYVRPTMKRTSRRFMSRKMWKAINVINIIISAILFVTCFVLLMKTKSEARSNFRSMNGEIETLEKRLSEGKRSGISLLEVLKEEIAINRQQVKSEMNQIIDRELAQLNNTFIKLQAETRKNISLIQNGLCEVSFNSKCFTVISPPSAITLTEGKEKCREIGGKLANIYSRKHFHEIVNILRRSIKIGWSMINTWTGMTFDTEKRVLLLSDNTPAPFEKWLAGRPFTTALPYVGIHVHERTSTRNQGLFDDRTTALVLSALCEF